MKKWKCAICGYIHEGENPPDECPVCHAPKEAFDPVSVVNAAGTDEYSRLSKSTAGEQADTRSYFIHQRRQREHGLWCCFNQSF